jgi:uncharacterized protein (DUF302 family)
MIEATTVPYSAARREVSARVDFATATQRLEASLGTMSLEALDDVPAGRASGSELRARLESMAGSSGFALFQRIDHGAILTALADRPTRALTYVFGNALIAVEMTRHAPAVGLYVPPRLFVIEPEPGTTTITYDLPSATLAQFADEAVMRVAHRLDTLIGDLVEEALGG